MAVTKKPVRAHSITITAGADTFEGLIAELKQIVFDMERGMRNSALASPSTGHIVEYSIDPTMTHDRYMTLIDGYFKESGSSD